jgi:predicted nucleic acid-binding protein
MAAAGLEAAIDPGVSLVVDTSAILAYLDGTELVSDAAAFVLDRLIATGRNSAVVSAVSVTEALVRPLRARSASATGTIEAFLRSFPNLSIEPVTYEIAREAARIRAATALRTPDTLILATASVLGSGVVVANDDRWRGAIERADLAVAVCHLDMFVAEAYVEKDDSER